MTTYATLARLSGALHREEHLLQLVLAKLVEQELLLQWRCEDELATTTDELALAIDELADADRDRDLEARLATISTGVIETASLRTLAAAVSLHWRPVLEAHRRTLAGLLNEIEGASRTVMHLLERDTERLAVPMLTPQGNGGHYVVRRMTQATVAQPLPGALVTFVR